MNRSGLVPSIKIDLANPTVLYSILWLLSLFLYSLDITTNILGLNTETVVLILISIGSAWLAYSYLWLGRSAVHIRRYSFVGRNPDSKIIYFKRIIMVLIALWSLLSFCEIVYFKGIPLISVAVLGQYDLDYKAFGIPTVHGFLNACYLTILTSLGILYFFERKRKVMLLLVALLVWPVLLMSRALLLWALLEVFAVYLIFHKLTMMRILKTSFYFLCFIVLFGWIGDNRGDSENSFTDKFIKEEHEDIAKFIPSGFIWAYLYLSTPINNIVYNIETIKPDYSLRYTTVGLIPSFIRDKIYDNENEKYALDLYSEAFNVSSFFANYLRDLGIVGTLILVLLLQSLSINLFFSARDFKLGSMIAYSCLFYAIFLSVFSDFFFSLVTVFQVMIGLFINYLLYSKKHVQR